MIDLSNAMALSSLQLDAFLMVAKTANFTSAAERLHVTQSALSQRILNLEAELDTTLFIRDRAGIRLTEPAQTLLRYCQMKDGLEHEVLSNIRSKSQTSLAGTLRIAGISSVMRSVVLPSLQNLLTRHPDVQLQFSVHQSDELMPLLKSSEVDFIVSDKPFDRADLVSLKLGSEENILVEKRSYKGADIYIDHDERDDVTLSYLKLSRTKAAKVKRHFAGDVYALLDSVKLGIGRAVLPKHLVSAEKSLIALNPRTVLEIPIFLHYYRQPYYSKLHSAVLTDLETGFKCTFQNMPK